MDTPGCPMENTKRIHHGKQHSKYEKEENIMKKGEA
jgi:hypothetical protein